MAVLATAEPARAQAPNFDPCALYPSDASARRDWVKRLVRTFGYAEFHEPPVVRPTVAAAPYELVVEYTKGKTIAGCDVALRSYNGQLVGATIRAKPGDTLYIRLTNKLPADAAHDHPQDPHAPDHGRTFSFNVTNLHTHGLHTSPQDDGDNVFLQIHPEKFPGDAEGTQLYRIHIHDQHPSGTFWYHAHLHGSTAVQLSSGMAGALIVEGGADANGGLDAVPEIRAAAERVFVLQQIRFDADGRLESFEQTLPSRKWSRNVTVNGVFVPTLRLRPGEVQRWRFVHAGVEDNIHLSLDGHQLHEIAADGLALGRRVSWPALEETAEGVRSLVLGPGYRTDVLVKAAPLTAGETAREFFLRDEKLPAALSLQAVSAAVRIARAAVRPSAAALLDAIGSKPQQVIARIVVEGAPVDMDLPNSEALRDRVPTALTPIRDEELTGEPQTVRFDGVTSRTCSADGHCPPCTTEAPDCKPRFTVDDRVFMTDHPPRPLKLGQASEWTLIGDGQYPHPFHIHVNPFEFEREEPGPDGKLVRAKLWKDTINLPQGESPKPIVLRSRYTMFEGDFVLHCHILSHEDMGMMQRVRISR